MDQMCNILTEYSLQIVLLDPRDGLHQGALAGQGHRVLRRPEQDRERGRCSGEQHFILFFGWVLFVQNLCC